MPEPMNISHNTLSRAYGAALYAAQTSWTRSEMPGATEEQIVTKALEALMVALLKCELSSEVVFYSVPRVADAAAPHVGLGMFSAADPGTHEEATDLATLLKLYPWLTFELENGVLFIRGECGRMLKCLVDREALALCGEGDSTFDAMYDRVVDPYKDAKILHRWLMGE